MAKEINVTIDGIQVTVPEGTTILDAAKKANINIPTLCYHEDLEATGSCGICVVEIEGAPTLKRSCCTPVAEGWNIKTHTERVVKARKAVLELILSNHPNDCLQCVRNQTCELQALTERLNIRELPFRRTDIDFPIDDNGVIIRDPNKCILCGRCVQVCQDMQTVYALEFTGRGYDAQVAPFMSKHLAETVCVNCGQCINFCPVGALYEKTDIDKVREAIADPDKIVVVQEAPAIRAALGEEFGMNVDDPVTGKMYAALRRLGFDYVFDTNFTADLTIVEEGNEVIQRLMKGERIPCITSCSPGWIKFMETYYPDFRDNVSTAKSPQQMFGAVAKTYFAEKMNMDPAKIVSVSIMPCTAKKFESSRPEMKSSGFQDVDYVLTTRELGRMIREAGIDFPNLPDEEVDSLLGEYTGAGTIFGATGGVMEAGLRTVYELLSGQPADYLLNLTPVRGMEGVKEASLDIPLKDGGTLTAKVAVAHGLGNARKIMDKLREAKEKGEEMPYHFIEIMACPGGCVGGGGQPYGSTFAQRARRGEILYKDDEIQEYRKSHENPEIKKIYEEYLKEPLGEKSHKLLHTHYVDRSDLL